MAELKLLQHQREGVDHILAARRVLLGDQPGTGKTMVVLKTAEAAIDETRAPGLIVCKASLRPNFQDEVAKWLPGMKVQVLTNKAEIETADLYIAGFETAAAKANELAKKRFGFLGVDESHYLKNTKAKRTLAMKEIAKRMPRDAVRVLASATPGVSRPRELVAQLGILDRMEQIAESDWKFYHRYCGPVQIWNPHKKKKVWNFDGHSNLSELRARLLESGVLLRRMKADVLELPAQRFVDIEIPTVGPAWEDYFEAQSDFMGWLTKQNGGQRPRVTPQVIEQLTALRRMSAAAKVPWVAREAARFTERGQSLVIMLHHRDAVTQVAERIESERVETTRIIGGQSDAKRRKAVAAFQSGKIPVIVCSLEAAAEGLTLIRASNLWFGELPFTPGRFDQGADRVHRVGQTEEVTIASLVAKGTIDGRIGKALRRKRKVLAELFDGEMPEYNEGCDDQSIFGELTEWYSTNTGSATAAT